MGGAVGYLCTSTTRGLSGISKVIMLWNLRNRRVKNVVGRYFPIKRLFKSLRVAPVRYAPGVNTLIPSTFTEPKRVSERWTYSRVRCEYCALVDHSELYLRGGDELRKCLYAYHGLYPPTNAITDDSGQLFVSPTGTTCSHFLSGAW